MLSTRGDIFDIKRHSCEILYLSALGTEEEKKRKEEEEEKKRKQKNATKYHLQIILGTSILIVLP